MQELGLLIPSLARSLTPSLDQAAGAALSAFLILIFLLFRAMVSFSPLSKIGGKNATTT